MMSEKTHQAIDKTPMDSVVTPMGNDDVIIVDTSYASSMMSLKNHQAIDKTPMENDYDVLYVGNEFWTFSTDDPILKWFTSLQNIFVEESGIILNLQWVDTSGRQYIPPIDIARLDHVRSDFLSLINTPEHRMSADIKKFLQSRAYFQIQVECDNTLYSCTKPDGLCLLRSVWQQKCGSSIEMRKHTREFDVWNNLDVDLSEKERRGNFIDFLLSLIEALKSKSLDINIWIQKIEFTINKIVSFQGVWSEFKLESAYWCGNLVLKCIPHVYSNFFIPFKGAYFTSNSEEFMTRFRKGSNWHRYACLMCAMQWQSSDVHNSGPASVRYDTMIKIFMGNKFVYKSKHYFPIKTNCNIKVLEACVEALKNKIIQFIHEGNVPVLPNIMEEVDSGQLLKQSSRPNEVTAKKYRQEEDRTTEWYRTELKSKDDEIKRLKDELDKYKLLKQ
jgi:hypothetical protein